MSRFIARLMSGLVRPLSPGLFLGLLLIASNAQANPFQRDIARPGNEAFHKGDYESAASEYLKAQDLEPLSAELNFNLGSTYYRQEDFDRAIEAFERSKNADDPGLAGAAHYNLGNSRYKASKRDYEAAVATAGGEGAAGAAGAAVRDYIKKLEECVKDYEETLKRIPQDENAKYNLEMIRREIKNLLRRQPPEDQQQQEQDPQQQQQEKDDQDQKEQNQDQQNQQQADEKKEEDGEKDEEKEKQNQKQQQEQQQAEQQEGDQGSPTPQPQPGQGEPTPTPAQASEAKPGEGEPTPGPTLSISEEMARNLLDNLPEQRPRTRQQRERNVEKDW